MTHNVPKFTHGSARAGPTTELWLGLREDKADLPTCFLGGLFGPVCEIDVVLNDAESRKTAELKTEDGKVEKHYLFYDGESVSGKVNLNVKQTGKRLEHQGIRIEFVGQIELFSDKSNTHEFVNLVKELALPGELTQNRSYDFEFMQVEKPYESYVGANVRLRYFLKVTIVRRLSDLVKEYDLIVHQLATYPDVNNSIKMEVGIEDCLHIEFEYNKSKYHLKDVIVGKIYFLLVRIKIQHMELQLIKKEMTGIGPSTTTETETVAKYEIMDGAPVKGESIPIRLFLAGYDLTATMRDVNKKFSVRYFLNLVLVDEEDRRYFKQQEIVLWRKAPEKLRKRNFHQRYESPESRPSLSAEQPEISWRPPDTSLFVPLAVKSDSTADAAVGAELTRPLDKSELLKVLNRFYKRKEMQKLAADQGLDACLFHQAFISFRKYVLEINTLSADLHIVLSDICYGAGHIDDIFPYFMRHAKQIFPMLECMDDLRKISDLRVPANWYPDARAIPRKIIFHAGPTNSGKTYHAIQRYLEAKSGIYCGPLKLLAHEIFEKSNTAGVPCDLVTGEERTFVDPAGKQSNHVACTIEMCSVTTPYEVAVIDEIQMIRDPARGWAWTRALLGLCAEEIHVCGEPAAISFITELMFTTGEEVEVRNYERLTPFSISDHAVENLDNLKPGDCIVCFSKNDIYSVSRQIEIQGLECAVIYGSLPPGTKLAQAKKFNDPDDPCKILVATDAIGMGLNLSIRRIIFNSLLKPSVNEKGEKQMDTISTSQALQIAGRAGRFSSMFKEGEVTTMHRDDLPVLKEILRRSVDPVESAGLHPTAEQIEMFAYYLPDATLSNLLFARQFSRDEPLTFAWMCRHIRWPLATPNNIKALVHLEAVHDVLDLYLWLSYRFMDMFPDANLVREIQKELDNIIQLGVRNITRLIRATEGQTIGAGSATDSKTSPFPGLRLRKARGSKSHVNMKQDIKETDSSLSARLVQEGLLTPELLQQLQREWTKDQNISGPTGTNSKFNNKK
ncbi:ATP-dependent RNA helicase SUPV3L1, mitochondrial [Bagarius yarrelli]|uniref:ATP-dependent RNA helicase SUPV3L1, mitochondrial n=1 Tax=Bagarius yarrelli TaxID=175774 RepID=A0A556TMJ7_BAGYA|nr:ATP-dependent RNA helicase SUPV3L1, mitochondrial [Bagarius yarrelli]